MSEEDQQEIEKQQKMASAADDINRFVSELANETDRGAALVAAAVIEERLGIILRAFFREQLTKPELNDLFGKTGHLGTFASKISIAHAVCLITPDEQREILTLKKIRNDFAHKSFGLSFDLDPMKSHVDRLQWSVPHVAVTHRARFLYSAMNVMNRLLWRDIYAQRARRKDQTWVSDDTMRYRSFKEEVPQPGQRIITFGPHGPVAATQFSPPEAGG